MAYPDNVFVGQNHYVTAWAEDDGSSTAVWGTKPGHADQFFMPVDDYSVKLQKDRRNNKPYLGQFGTKHGRSYKGMPQGQLRGKLHGFFPTALSKSIAQFWFDLAFGSPTANALPSFGCEFAAGPDVANKQHDGMRINQFTVTGSEQSGVCEFTADCMGKTETQVATAQTIPNDLEKILDFEFPDVTFEFDLAGGTSYTAYQIESFQLQRNNGLKPKYLNSRTPTALMRTMRETNLQIVLPKHSDAWDDYARVLTSDAEPSARLTLIGNHNGTSSNTYAKVIIVFPRLQLVLPDDRMSLEDYTMTTLPFQCLKPDTSAAEISLTWSTSA